MNKQIKTMLIVSSFSGYPNQIELLSKEQSTSPLVLLQAEALQDHERFLSTLQNAWTNSKTPYIFTSAKEAISILDLFAGIPFITVFIAPDSVDDYWASMLQQVGDHFDRLCALRDACDECAQLWKFNSVVSTSALKTTDDLESILKDNNAFPSSFDILEFKEGLEARLQEYLDDDM